MSAVPREKVWIGPSYRSGGIFVLGESWYGEYTDELVTDDGWIRAYLDGQVVDRMYTRMANACGLSRRDFWESIMFTNFVQCVGAAREDRPTAAMYAAAKSRLSALLEAHQPRGVWVLGIGQAEYTVPTIEAAGVIAEVTPHPTSYGLSNAALGASWRRLNERIAA
jgi:hypothetical protein